MSRLGSWLRNLFSRHKKPLVPEERIRQAAESVVEDEGLTDYLDDEAASVLISWGVACAQEIARSTAGMDDKEAEAAMYLRMRALRQMLRAVNRWIPRRLEMSDEDNRAALEKVVGQAARVYGERFVPPDEERQRTFLYGDLAFGSARAIAGLRALLEEPGGE